MKRICLLTGAGGLLGDRFCRRLAAHYDIAAVYRHDPPLAPSQDAALFDPLAPRRQVPEAAHPVFTIRADLGQPAEIGRVVELTLARFDRIDLLVNAAADVRTCSALGDPYAWPEWERQLLTNSLVPVMLAATVNEACWRGHDQRNRTRNCNVVNVSSTAGLGRAPGEGRGVYGASKAALNVLTKQLAQEYLPLGVRVNAVAPTFFPDVVKTRRVIDGICTLDTGRMSGRILILDGTGDQWG